MSKTLETKKLDVKLMDYMREKFDGLFNTKYLFTYFTDIDEFEFRTKTKHDTWESVLKKRDFYVKEEYLYGDYFDELEKEEYDKSLAYDYEYELEDTSEYETIDDYRDYMEMYESEDLGLIDKEDYSDYYDDETGDLLDEADYVITVEEVLTNSEDGTAIVIYTLETY